MSAFIFPNLKQFDNNRLPIFVVNGGNCECLVENPAGSSYNFKFPHEVKMDLNHRLSNNFHLRRK